MQLKNVTFSKRQKTESYNNFVSNKTFQEKFPFLEKKNPKHSPNLVY